MKYQASIDRVSKWPRVWGVEDTSLVDLSDEYTAIELFVEDPTEAFYHIFRYILETEAGDIRIVSEGILLGQSESPDRPKLRAWSGQCDDLNVLSCINLGVEVQQVTFEDEEAVVLSGKINDDPIVFLNFDPETTTARFMTAPENVPALVRERHLGYLPKPAKAV